MPQEPKFEKRSSVEPVFGIEYDKLHGPVKEYVDAMIADVKQIYTGLKFGSLEEFVVASRKGNVPKDTIRKVRDLIVEIHRTSKTQEIPQEARERLNEKERRKQARVLWDAGIGNAQGYPNFESYLAEIPEIPDWPETFPDYLDRVVLVDARLPVKQTCLMLDVHNREVLVEERNIIKQAYWIKCQDGHAYQRVPPKDFHNTGWYEIAMNAIEGLALYAQDREILKTKQLFLLSTRDRQSSEYVAYLSYDDKNNQAILGTALTGTGDKRFDWGIATRGHPVQ